MGTLRLYDTFNIPDDGAQQYQCAHQNLQPHGVLLLPGIDGDVGNGIQRHTRRHCPALYDFVLHGLLPDISGQDVPGMGILGLLLPGTGQSDVHSDCVLRSIPMDYVVA